MNLDRRHRGFTLTELMVAMTVGLIVLGSVLTVLVNSKKNYVTQDSLARLQENARFALNYIVRDLRMAGYYGCMNDIDAVTDHVNNGGTGSLFDSSVPLEGFEQGADTWKPSDSTLRVNEIYNNTDAITIRFADGSNRIPVEKPYMPQPSAALQLAAGNGLEVGEIVVVTDCASADIFQITGPQDPDIAGTINHNTGAGVSPGNATQNLSKSYEENSKIIKIKSVRFFIGTGASGYPALFRDSVKVSSGAAAPQVDELVDGIENMQILYGIDTNNNDGVPDTYVNATNVGTNWDNVVAVRITLLAFSISSATSAGEYGTGADDSIKNYDLGFADAASDKTTGQTGSRKRRIFTSTVQIRNSQ